MIKNSKKVVQNFGQDKKKKKKKKKKIKIRL